LLLSAFKLSHKGCGSSGGQNIWLGSNAPPPPPARPTSPEEILSSPDLPPPVPATTGICGSTTSTYGKSLDVPYEWVEVPGGAEVPVSGQVINVPVPSADVPWSHPFGLDYTFNLAIDKPYLGLLEQSQIDVDCSPAGIAAGRGESDICNGSDDGEEESRESEPTLHTEFERDLVPESYRPVGGDRVFMRGHLIVDCGHERYWREIHPPTLLARANLDPSTGNVRSTLIVMPYRATENYKPLALNFIQQAEAELVAAAGSPTGAPLYLFANIDTTPFSRPVVAHYRVAIPTVPGRTITRLGYHFVVRPGVDVKVAPINAYQADVTVTLDPASYRPFAQPSCQTVTIPPEGMEALMMLAPGTISRPLGWLAPDAIPLLPYPLSGLPMSLKAGILVEKCTVANNVPQLPGSLQDNQVVVDERQPYPAYGWLDLKWEP